MAPEIDPEPESAHLLVVEDDVLIRTNTAEMLRAAGWLVVEAANADEAWAYVQTGAVVDLMFSDIQMPGSVNGIELARRMKENHPDIVVVLTSGGAAPAPGAEHQEFIKKPYRLTALVEKFKAALARRE